MNPKFKVFGCGFLAAFCFLALGLWVVDPSTALGDIPSPLSRFVGALFNILMLITLINVAASTDMTPRKEDRNDD